MASSFEINICASDTGCDGVTFVDQTGVFGLVENPLAYGAPNDTVPSLDVDTGVYNYDSYTLEVWYAAEGGLDETAPPDFTLDLLTATHTVDADTGYVTWELSLEDLGVETIRSGWWLFRVTGVFTNDDDETFNYVFDAQMAFIEDLTTQTDAMMSTFNVAGCCDDCAKKKADLYQKYWITKKYTACCADEAGFTRNVDYLLANLPLCSDC